MACPEAGQPKTRGQQLLLLKHRLFDNILCDIQMPIKLGPLRDVGANNDRKEFMERAGYIPLDADKRLRDAYHAKQHMGFPLCEL